MTQLPDWVAWTVAIGSPVLTFAGVAWAARLNRRGLKRSAELAEREETLKLLRWAAELAGSGDVEKVRLGVAELDALSRSERLGANGSIFVSAALEVAVRDAVEAIENPRTSADPGLQFDAGQRDAAVLLMRIHEEEGTPQPLALRRIAEATVDVEDPQHRTSLVPESLVDEPDELPDADNADSDDAPAEDRDQVRARRAARRAARAGREQNGRGTGGRGRERRQNAS